MSDTDRRYDRQEPPLTMDSRRGRSRGPAPVTLIVSLLLLVAVVGDVFYMYRTGVRGSSDGPQPLGAPLGDVRSPAPAQAQTPDPSAGLTISKDDPNAVAGAPTLAPAPEQPLPPQPPRSTAPVALAPAPTPVPPPAAVATASLPPPPAATVSTTQAVVAPRTAPVRTGAQPKAEDKSDAIDRLIAKADKPRTDTRADAKVGKLETPAAAGGPVFIQIGAFSSETLADKEWSKAAAVAPGDMAGKGKHVVPVDRDGATLYRTSITGFASRDQAVALCEKLKSAGGSCFVR